MTAVGYVGGDPTKVSRSGDTMTGDLALPGNPDQPLEAATKQYVDAAAASVETVLDLPEVATPAPIANTMRLYATDNNGLTELRQLDPSGNDIDTLHDVLLIVRNETGGTLTKGTAVYITGIHPGGGVVSVVAPARADASGTMSATGVVHSDIANNSFGYVMHHGILSGVNTSAFAVNDRLYVSATTAGTLTNVRPVHPNYDQVVARVMRSHASNGIIHVLTRQAMGEEVGTRSASWGIGDGTAGAKTLRLLGSFPLSVTGSATAPRTVTIPDASGTLILGPDNAAEQVTTWIAADEWLRVNTPFSANDSNPDLLRIFNGSIVVQRWNGNGEGRRLPSAVGRVGARDYEYLDGSNDIFWETSTNPSGAGVRETLVGCYGTLHATRPGWLLVRETVLARSLQTSSPITVSGTAVYPGTGWQDATLNASITAGTAVAPGSQREGNRIFLRGRLSWVGQTFGAGTVLLTVHADHRPLTTKTFSVRTSANSSVSVILELASNGQLTNNATLGTTTTAFLGLDGQSYDLS